MYNNTPGQEQQQKIGTGGTGRVPDERTRTQEILRFVMVDSAATHGGFMCG